MKQKNEDEAVEIFEKMSINSLTENMEEIEIQDIDFQGGDDEDEDESDL